MSTAKPTSTETALATWQGQCETIYDKVSLLLQDREQLCSRLAQEELSLQELLLSDELPEVAQGIKLLTVLDSVSVIGKVRARKLLQHRQSWKIGQFQRQELADIVRQVNQPEAAA